MGKREYAPLKREVFTPRRVKSFLLTAQKDVLREMVRIVEGRIVPVDSIENVGSEVRYGQLAANQTLTDLATSLREIIGDKEQYYENI